MEKKAEKLEVSLSLLNNKLHFEGGCNDNQPISIDYIPPLGDNLGYTSLELLLLSLSSCIGSTLLIFLRKMNKNISDMNIIATGKRKKEHPTGFEVINIELNIQSVDLVNSDIDKVLKLSEESYCPVWSMLKGNVEINVKYNISDKDDKKQ